MFHDSQIVIITNSVVVSSAGIKRVVCIQLGLWKFVSDMGSSSHSARLGDNGNNIWMFFFFFFFFFLFCFVFWGSSIK